MIKIRHILIFNDASAFSVRFLHERHEQTKQDLKGLEETVVSKTDYHYLSASYFTSSTDVYLSNLLSIYLSSRPANSRPSTTCASCSFKTSRRELKK